MADIKESAMTRASDGAYIRALDADNNSILISKADLLGMIPFSGSECTFGIFDQPGWYRIISGVANYVPVSGIINMGNVFGSIVPQGLCFYFLVNGYGVSESRFISKIGQVGGIFSKARIVYKNSTTDKLMIDIYYNFNISQRVDLALGCALNCRIADLAYVEENNIPEGYAVQEVIF